MTVTAGTDAQLNSSLGVSVIIPGAALSGSGHLTVASITNKDGLAGFAIDLNGATLIGAATLVFTHTMAEGEPAPLIAYSEQPTDDLTLATEGVVTATGVTLQTTHFSNWFVSWWGDVASNARAALDHIYSSAAQGTQPVCDREDEVRNDGVTVTSSNGSKVLWCLGKAADGTILLKVTNARGYAASIEETSGMILKNDSTNINTLLPQLFSVVTDLPHQKGNAVHLLAAGATNEYQVTGQQQQAVDVRPSPGGYLATSLLYGASTVQAIAPFMPKGKGTTRDSVLKAMDAVGCVAGAQAMTTDTVLNSSQAASYLNTAISTVFGCLADTLKRQFGLEGLIAGAVVGGITWLISGVTTILNGLGAAADAALDPVGYIIGVTPSAGKSSAISDESIKELSIPAGACVSWPNPSAIQLADGQGENFDAAGKGTGIFGTRLIGSSDLTGDGIDDAVLVIHCTGTPLAQCCVGRSSTTPTVIALDLNRTAPQLIGTPIIGGTLRSSEGDVSSVIYDDDIHSPRLEGSDILTYEGPLFLLDDPLEEERISGWFRHTFVGGEWGRADE